MTLGPSSRFEEDNEAQTRAVAIADAKKEARAKEFPESRWVTDVNGEHGYDPSKVNHSRRFTFAFFVLLSLLYPLCEYLAYHALSNRIEKVEAKCLGG